MWNVLLVEPWTPGQAPVARLYQPAPVFGRRLGQQAVAGGRRAVLEERGHRGHQALGGVLLDQVLAHAVGCEEDGRVGCGPPVPAAGASRPTGAASSTRAGRRRPTRTSTDGSGNGSRCTSMPTGHTRLEGRRARAGRTVHRTQRNGMDADDNPLSTGREGSRLQRVARPIPVESPASERRSTLSCVTPAQPWHPVGRRAARPARAGPARRGDGAARAGAVRRAGGVRQDDDARRAGGLARRRRRGRRRRSASSRSTSGRPRSSTSGSTPRSAPLGRRGRARSASGRSTRSAARCSREAGVSVEPLVDRDALLRELFPEADARRTAAGSTSRSRGSSSTSASRPTTSPRDPAPGPVAQRVRRLRAGDRGARAASTSTTSSSARSACSRPTRRVARAAGARAARTLLVDEAQDLDRTQLELALLLAAPGERRLPRGRRRPVDLRLAAGRRATGPRPRGVAAGPAAGRPRDQLPLPAAGRRARRPARRAQPRAVREADRARDRRPTGRLVLAPDAADDLVRVDARDADLARRRRRPAPSSPGRTASCWSAVVAALDLGVPFRAPDLRAADRGRAARRPARSRGRRRPARPGRSPLLALGRLAADAAATRPRDGEDAGDARRRGRPDAAPTS